MIGINGMGRIGRTFFRVLLAKGEIDRLAAINDTMPKKHLIYLLKYDTVRGEIKGDISATAEGLRINNHEIKVFNYDHPKDIPWSESNVKIAVEATGSFTDINSLKSHLDSGASYSIVTTTGGENVPLFISGVNDEDYQNESAFSIGSCTVNGSAPILKMLEIYEPSSVYLNVIHAYSARQNILDSYYPEIRRSRASADNIIPLNINLDLSLERLYPSLQGKIKSITSRVPVPCGVLSDMTIRLKNPPKNNADFLNQLKESASKLVGLVNITDDPIVSSDVINNSHSATIDSEFAHIMDDHAKLLVWFDNEWGFSNRLYEWVRKFL